MKYIINWCKTMFQPTDGVIIVNTASCQNGALSAHRPAGTPEESAAAPVEAANQPEEATPTAQPATVKLEENTIFLNRREASFINKEVHRLLKAKLAETERKKKAGVPLPPEPGKINYAVYQ